MVSIPIAGLRVPRPQNRNWAPLNRWGLAQQPASNTTGLYHNNSLKINRRLRARNTTLVGLRKRTSWLRQTSNSQKPKKNTAHMKDDNKMTRETVVINAEHPSCLPAIKQSFELIKLAQDHAGSGNFRTRAKGGIANARSHPTCKKLHQLVQMLVTDWR